MFAPFERLRLILFAKLAKGSLLFGTVYQSFDIASVHKYNPQAQQDSCHSHKGVFPVEKSKADAKGK